MPYGYNGKILHLNLSSGEFTIEQPPEAFYRKFMGGSALNMYYLLTRMPAGGRASPSRQIERNRTENWPKSMSPCRAPP